MRTLVVTAVLVLSITSSFAATHNIPSDFTTIQSAVDASTSGDTILVASSFLGGAGNRDIDFGGRNLMLKSTSTTLIDIGGILGDPHRAFYFHNGETANCVIDGFSLVGGGSKEMAVRC